MEDELLKYVFNVFIFHLSYFYYSPFPQVCHGCKIQVNFAPEQAMNYRRNHVPWG